MVKQKSASGSSRRGVRPGVKPGITVVDARHAAALADKAAPIVERQEIDTSDIPETDFGQSQAVRGKHHAAFVRASGLVQLDPDVREAFPDDASVNRALHLVIELANDLRSLN